MKNGVAEGVAFDPHDPNSHLVPTRKSKRCFEKAFSDIKTYIFWLCFNAMCFKLDHANTAAEVAVRNCNELNWFYAEEFFAEFFIDAALEQKV